MPDIPDDDMEWPDDDMGWLEDDEGDGSDVPWDFPPKSGTPWSWLELFRPERVTMILCPDAILGRVCASLRLALRTDEDRCRNTLIIVTPRGDDASRLATAWVERTCDGVRWAGVDAFIIIPEDRDGTGGGLRERTIYTVLPADRVVELSCDPGGRECCIHRTLKDRKVENLFGKISFLG